MHLQPSPSLMNTTTARSRTSAPPSLRRKTRASTGAHPPDFADTLPMAPPKRLKRAHALRSHLPMPAEVLSTYLLVYLVVFADTLTVPLITTELTLALDVVTLVARESLWFTPIVGTALVLTAWRRRSYQAALARPAPEPAEPVNESS